MRLPALVGLVTGLLTCGAAAAQPVEPLKHSVVERSGRVFHMAACPAAGYGVAHCHAHIVTDANGSPLLASRGAATPNTLFTCQTTNPATCLSPVQLRAAYNISGGGSSGTTVAIVDAYAYPNAAADLAQFRSFYGLPACTLKNRCLRIVNETGGTRLPRIADSGWDVEQAADLDMVSAMCPNCRIILVQANSANFLDLATAANEGAKLGAHVISNSYGGGEVGSQPYESFYNHAGVAVTASTGDSGYGVAFPSTSPHVIAVGGTTLNMSGNSRTGETAWSGAGSGCSTVYFMPTWQQPSNANMKNNTLCGFRVVADISAEADPNTGVIFYMNISGYSPGFYVVGGTSVSNQIIAGIYGERGGSVNYGQNPYLAPSAALNDVTSGSSGSCGGTYLCTAVPGYDGPTGLGTPNGDTAF